LAAITTARELPDVLKEAEEGNSPFRPTFGAGVQEKESFEGLKRRKGSTPEEMV